MIDLLAHNLAPVMFLALIGFLLLPAVAVLVVVRSVLSLICSVHSPRSAQGASVAELLEAGFPGDAFFHDGTQWQPWTARCAATPQRLAVRRYASDADARLFCMLAPDALLELELSDSRIGDEGLLVSDGEKRENLRWIACDTVVLCAGQLPLRELADALLAQGQKAHLIGGAHEAGELDAKRAIDQAARLAAAL